MINRNLIISVALILLCHFTCSFHNKESRSKLVKLAANLFVSPTEVSNMEYRAFLDYLYTSGLKEKYAICLYDSSQWQKAVKNPEPLTAYYHRHAVYNDYPVVNISHEAMQLYCDWLTLLYEKSEGRKYKKVVYRLPKETEYERIIIPIPAKPGAATSGQNKYANIRSENIEPVELTAPVYAYSPNKAGLYNTIGNVSEVTQEGKIVGGNFTSDPGECNYGTYQQYTLPDARVGFRVIMEITEF